MALNLSTLTSPATSGDVLAEALTTADFLESVPVLRNLARGSQKGGDAKQAVALNQPKALPLIDGDGYCYLSGVSGNYAEVNTPILPATGDFDLSIDFVFKGPVPNDRVELFHQYDNSSGRFLMSLTSDNKLRVFWGPVGTKEGGVIVDGQKHTARLERSGSSFTLSLDGTPISTWTSSAAIVQLNSLIGFGALSNDRFFKGAIFSVTEGSNVNIDFTANVRHGDTKFQCATGQVVTINQSGQNPASIIKKPVLRFDGVNDGLKGLLGQTVTGGYFFAAYSVVGGGGQNFGRVASLNSTGETDTSINYAILAMRGGAAPATGTRSIINGIGQLDHDGMFSDDVKDVLFELKFTASNAVSKINNSNTQSVSGASTVDAEEFNIAANATGSNAGAIDLEYLALFPASITDAQADAVRNYINNRNNVFLRHDTDGYYFFDPQKVDFVGNFTEANTLDGYITGSDNGDTDVRTNLTLEQPTLNDQPYADGYKITFNDSAEHLEFDNAASQTLAGWQVVGTSLGTFVYKVDSDAVTELNLLGNLGSASHRKAGDLYGIILLPESATGRDIEQARKLLIDRGAADAPTGIISNYFRNRQDIVSFGLINTSTVSDLGSAWYYCTNITSFPLIDTSTVTGFSYAWGNNQSLTSFPLLNTSAGSSFINTWYNCVSLNNFPALNMSNGTSFSGAWKSCSSLTSFPADAKLGTEASNVDFTSAWRDSGLTSFSTPLPTATTASNAWRDCTSLTSFSTELPLATSVSNAWRGCSSLESFSSALPSVTDLSNAWQDCSSLESFSEELPLVINAYAAWYRCASLESFSTELPLATSTRFAWYQCTSLTDFSADVFANWNPSSILSGVFNIAWDGCTSLTSQSVENILTSIDSSGKYGTSNGLSGGTPLADAGIDIDYNGDPLSAATTAAITSLKSKGWSIFINSVEQ